MHPYLSLGFAHFVFLFSPSILLFSPRDTFNNLQCLMISLQSARNITEIKKKYFIVFDGRKSVALIVTKTNSNFLYQSGLILSCIIL